MNHLLCTSLSHTYYWYEVGMLKVPTVFLVCFGEGALFYMWRQLEKLEVCAINVVVCDALLIVTGWVGTAVRLITVILYIIGCLFRHFTLCTVQYMKHTFFGRIITEGYICNVTHWPINSRRAEGILVRTRNRPRPA